MKPSTGSRSKRETRTFLWAETATYRFRTGGFPSKQFRKYCIISSMQAAPLAKARLANNISGPVRAFLDYCRVEKGLAANTLLSYRTDLQAFKAKLPKGEKEVSHEDLSGYIESLYKSGLSARSVARYIATLRNYFGFLAREGEVSADPTEFLSSPKQWARLPKYLNRDEVEKLLAAPG